MGCSGKDADSCYFSTAAGDVNDRCSTRKVEKARCHTEEVEPGRFIRKCKITEQIFKDCVGRHSVMIESDEKYTEEDITNEMVKGSFPFDSAKPPASSHFPGLRSDLEAIERKFFRDVYRIFEASEEMMKDFLNSNRIFDKESPSRGIRIEGERALPRKDVPENDEADVQIPEGLVKDV